MIDPRGVLHEFGLELAGGCRGARLGQHGGTPLPRLAGTAAGTEKLKEEALAALVTRDAMIGVAKVPPRRRREAGMNGVHDMGGMQDLGAIEREKNEPVFHEPWEGRVWALRAR